MKVETLGRLIYIEPNDLAQYQNISFGDNTPDNIKFQDEEYNSSVDLQIVVPNRSDCGYREDINGINVNISGLDNKGRLSFFEGETLDWSVNGGVGTPLNYLTTNYLECSYNDILNDNKKENLGIKSINIDFSSNFYPQVTIEFTDVRAAALIGAAEAEKDTDYQQSSFFKSVFHYPYPKFLLTVKGFYGTKVTFKLAVNEFKSKLTASGNFDVTITFIGYMYGLYTDIPMNFLLIAPYIGSDISKNTNDYWNSQTENGIFVYDNGTPIQTFVSYCDKYQRLSENISRKSDVLSNNTNIKKYNEYKKKLAALDDIINLYKQIVGLFSVGDSANIRVYSNDNLYFMATPINSEFNNAFIADTKPIDKFSDAVAKYNKKYGASISDIFNLDDSKCVFALCKEPYFLNGVVNKNVSENIYYKTISSETLNEGEAQRLADVLNEHVEELKNTQWAVFDSKHFLSTANKIRRKLMEDMTNIEGDASNEAAKAVADELGFAPTLENVFRMIFAHLDTFMHTIGSTISAIKDSKRTMSSVGIDSTNSDMPKKVSKNTFVPPFPMITQKRGHKNEWVYPGEFDGMKNSPEVQLINNIINATLSYSKNYDDILTYEVRLESVRNGGGLYRRFFPVMTSDFLYDGLNPYGFLENDEDLGEILYTFLLRYRAAYTTNKSIINQENDTPDFGRIEARNLFMVKPNCTDAFFENIKRAKTKGGFASILSEYIQKHKTQTVDNVNIGANDDYATFGKVDDTVLAFNNALSSKAKLKKILSQEQGASILAADKGEELHRFIDITAANQSLDDKSKFSEDASILSIVLDYDLYASTDSRAKALWYGMPAKVEMGEISKDAYNGNDSLHTVKSKVAECIATPSAFCFPLVQSGYEVKDFIFWKKYYVHNLFVRDEIGGGEIYDAEDEYDAALKFVSCMPHKVKDLTKARAMLLGRWDNGLDKVCDAGSGIISVPKYILLYLGGLLYMNQKDSSTGIYSIKDIKGNFGGLSEDKYFGGDDTKIAEEFTKNLNNTLRQKLISDFEAWTRTDFKVLRSFLDEKTAKYTEKAIDGIKMYVLDCNSEASKKLMGFFLEDEYIYSIQKETAGFNECEFNSVVLKFASELEILYRNVAKAEEKRKAQYTTSNVSLYNRLSIYITLKRLYDNWLSGVNLNKFALKKVADDIKERKDRFEGRINSPTASTEFNNFLFSDSYCNDLSSSFYINPRTLYETIKKISDAEKNLSLFQFMCELCETNKLLFLSLPTYNNYYTTESIKNMFMPHSLYDSNLNNKSIYGDTYLVFYMHKPSDKINANNNGDVQYDDDGFDIADVLGNAGSSDAAEVARIFSNTDNGGLNLMMPAFGVTYGRQNQSLFRSINVNMDGPKVTDFSIANTFQLGKLGNKGYSNEPFAVGQDMYAIYSNRSYTCTVEMMGCANIMPFMFFQLNNIPLFRGAYIIIEVQHIITPGNMLTKFTGVRVSKNELPFNKDVFNVRTFLTMVENYIETNSQ